MIRNEWIKANDTTWQCAAFEVYLADGRWYARDNLSHVVHKESFASADIAKRVCDLSQGGFEVIRRTGASYNISPTMTVTSGAGHATAKAVEIARQDKEDKPLLYASVEPVSSKTLWSRISAFLSRFL